MSLEMVLNEVSLSPTADKESARHRMFVLSQTARQAVQMGVKRNLRGPRQLERTFLCPGYTFEEWTKDEQVDLELRRYIRDLAAQSPFWKNDPALEENVRRRLFTLADGREAVGFGVAALLNSLAISLRSSPEWEAIEIPVSILTEIWSEDGLAETEEIQSLVRHASHKDAVGLHRDWIAERLRIVVADGAELWHRRETLFPDLSFCTAVQEQLENMPNDMLHPVIKHLAALQAYCQNWAGGAFDPDQIGGKVSTEGQATLEMFGEERTFVCPDGVARLFSWHVRLTPLAWRIHFLPLPADRRILIGYAGKHLRTFRDR